MNIFKCRKSVIKYESGIIIYAPSHRYLYGAIQAIISTSIAIYKSIIKELYIYCIKFSELL